MMEKFVFVLGIALIIISCTDHSTMVDVEGDSSSSALKLSSSTTAFSSSVIGLSSSDNFSSESLQSSSSVKLSSSAMLSSSSLTVKSSASVGSSSSVISSSSSQYSSSSITQSSSSLVTQSSSSVVFSSSSSSIEYGSIIYEGQTYKTVKIGTQTWMAENLNYADSTAMPNLKGNSWCYNNSADNCAKYGRLYTWTAAMNIASSYQSVSAATVISTPHQGACPVGWHIPTNAEWTTLDNAVGGSGTAGTYLKATSGWDDAGNGTDSYGFSALPAGNRYYDGDFYYVGRYADFWSATEHETDVAYYRGLSDDRENLGTYNHYKTIAFSVRCLKDS